MSFEIILNWLMFLCVVGNILGIIRSQVYVGVELIDSYQIWSGLSGLTLRCGALLEF